MPTNIEYTFHTDKKIRKKLLMLLAILTPLFSFSQDNNQNWVKQVIYKTPTTTPLSNPAPTAALVNVLYKDGLGRPIQQIANQQSTSGKDIVNHIEYDQFGRVLKQYLPYKSSNSGMEFTDPGTALSNTTSYPEYAGQLAYSESAFDGSPLNRLLKSAAPGPSSSWGMGSGHEIMYGYSANDKNDNVRRLSVTGSMITDLGQYGIKSLYENTITDENGQVTATFKNAKGQVILERKFMNATPLDTYYLYDGVDNLIYVIPPSAVGNYTATTLDNLCYQYKYDDMQRMVEQKLPQKEWEYIVYDSLDRIVATGPAFSPFGDGATGWMLIKYDKNNRPAYTAWSQHSFTGFSRLNLQAANSGAVLNAEKTTSGTLNGVQAYYTQPADVPSNFILLSVNYYDNYTFPDGPTSFTNVFYNNTTKKPVGMPTGSWQRVLGSTPTPILGETTSILYDYRGQAVEISNKNHLLKTTKTNSVYNFIGAVSSTTTVQDLLDASGTITVLNNYSYTAQGRLLKQTHKTNNNAPELMSYVTYNELGQVITKMVGGGDLTAATAFQKVDYSYNIRGWLKGINNPADAMPVAQPGAQNDLFAFAVNYNDNIDNSSTLYNVPKQHNGNISEISWRSAGDNQLRKYGFLYDSMNRMTNAVYQKTEAVNPTRGSYNESAQYDHMGNITGMQRNGNQDTQGIPPPIDDLVYYYDQNSNRITKIHDTTTSPLGFRDSLNSMGGAPASTADWDYAYDAKGNITLDKNKRITSITYNHLNQPVEIKFNNSNNSKILYLYNASGQKVQKSVTQIAQGGQSATTTTTNYLNGFQYMNSVLQFFPTNEGYVRNTVVSGVSKYNYVYNFKDHLGNVRLSYADDPQTHVLKILEENHYYPYGLKHTNYNADLNAFAAKGAGIELKALAAQPPAAPSTLDYNYKFNGVEWQDELLLNMYDMDMRDYDPATARWFNIDPVTHYDMSPYVGMNNNPVFYADPSGADGEPINTWHHAGTTSMNSFLNGGSRNLASGDHMVGGSKNSFWMSNGALTGGEQSNPFSLSGNNLNINWNRLSNGATKWNLASDNVYLWHESSVTYNGVFNLEDGGTLDTVDTGYWEKIFSPTNSGLAWTLKSTQLAWGAAGEFHVNPTKALKFADVAARTGFWGDIYSVLGVANDFSNPSVSQSKAWYNAAYTAFGIGAATRAGASIGGFGGALVGITIDMAPYAVDSAIMLWNQSVYAISEFTVNFRGHVR